VISPEGTIFLFHLATRRAERWVDEHVEPDAQWFGDAIVVEHRYAGNLAFALQLDGLSVEVL